MQLDLELGRIIAENGDLEPQQCDVCGAWVYGGDRCPVCPGRPHLTHLARLMERRASGEPVSFEEIMRASLGNGVKQD